MDPGIAALGASAIGAIGGYIGAGQSNAGARDMMHETFDLNRWMRGTAYQAATEDMKAAGLNPMLAYQQGGASNFQTQAAPVHDRIAAATNSALAAAQIAKLKAETKSVEAQTPGHAATSSRLGKELIELVPVQIRTAELQQDIVDTEAYFAGREKNYAMVNTTQRQNEITSYIASKFRMLPADVRARMAEVVVKELAAKMGREAESGYDSFKRGAGYIGDQIGKAQNSAVDAVRSLKHGYERFKSNRQFRHKYEFHRE